MMTRVLFLLIFGAVLFSSAARAETYTYPELVGRMTDLSELAKLPPPGEKTSLASSYDRRSKYDAATGTYVDWGANNDGFGIVRKEGDHYVLMDVQGPGCIWRIWAATTKAGHVKIYLDGSTTPTVDLPFTGYFDGKAAPFNRPNLVYVPSNAAHGFDNFTPIPFQKSCKIIAEKDWGAYYQFTYTQFPAGTVVPTFSMNLSAEDNAALDRADKLLGQCGQNPTPGASSAVTDRKAITVAAGKTATVDDLSGPGAITALKVKLDLPKAAEAQRELLRQLTISITWDGDKSPAVWSPLGDFFGYVGGADPFQSLPVGLMPDGAFYSYWYMPYGQKAHIEVGNDGPAPVATTWEVSHAPLDQPIATLARFHAKWHRDAFEPQRPDRVPDWTLLTTQGRGRYVGTHLHGWNPRGGWWGEGDDKFFIDGEKFPSSFGTGSEDYFGFAWSSSGHFSRPYHNQILNENNWGHFDDNRWHISDSVPFQTSFEGCIEKYVPSVFPSDHGVLYAAEAFWYLDASGIDPYGPVPVADRIGYWVRPDIYKEPRVIEGEWLRPAIRDPEIHTQEMYEYGKGWSNDTQLLWSAKNIGARQELQLPAQKAGKYHLLARYTKGPDYGIIQAGFNGTGAGQPIDLYSPKLEPIDIVDLGIVTLPQDGKPTFDVTITGKNPASSGVHFGLDYLKLTPAP
ncbi:MAG TPA: glycoside hydrolase family 172 protein [Chthoniobacteraceae bacterium]|nr:glycoside hydrolase family 172 protein [Chthoniobacteraceae bacterium]